jgi:hypothetical protein
MQTSEILRAKGLQAEVSYRVEMKQAGEAHSAVRAHKATVDCREQQVWREVIRHVDGAKTGVNAGRSVSMRHEWLHRAFKDLCDARAQHASSAQTLRHRLEVLSGAHQRHELIQGMIAAFNRRMASTRGSRVADDVAELASTSRAARGRTNPGTSESSESCHRPTPIEVTGTATQGRADVAPTPPAYCMAPIAESPLHYPAPMEIELIHTASGSEQASVSVSCAVAGGGSVGLRVTKSDSGEGIRAIIDPSTGPLAARIVADKGSVVARLQALGVKVTSLDIGGDEATNDGAARLPHRRASCAGDLYEDDIS